jgi:hypothetical protein
MVTIRSKLCHLTARAFARVRKTVSLQALSSDRLGFLSSHDYDPLQVFLVILEGHKYDIPLSKLCLGIAWFFLVRDPFDELE